MKNFIALSLLFATLGAMFVSCAGSGNEEYVVSEYLDVTSQITLATDGSQKGYLDIKANCRWIISGNPSWMSLSANSGSDNATVTITCTPNPSAVDERSAVLTVSSTSGKLKRSVTISQAASDEEISVNVDELVFGQDQGSKVLTITSNSDWTITGVEGWFALSKTSGSGNSDITVTAMSNEDEIERNATITVQGHNKSARVQIKQDARVRTLAVSPNKIAATAIGGSYKLNLSGDAIWTASSNSGWCTLSKYNGVGSDELAVTVTDNISTELRTSVITFTIKNGDKTCIVEQAPATMPQVTTFNVSDVDKHSFAVYMAFTSEFPVSEYGICFSATNETPTVANMIFKETTDNNRGEHVFTLSDLVSGKTYHVRAFAKSVVGTSYSEVKHVTTDGQVPGENDNPTPEV